MSEVDEGKSQIKSFITYHFLFMLKKLAFFFLLFCSVMLALLLISIIFITTKFSISSGQFLAKTKAQ